MTGVFHISVAMKPLDGNFASNAMRHGVAGINVDGCRILAGEQPKSCMAPGWDSINKANVGHGYRPNEYQQGQDEYVPNQLGRWPANVVLGHCDGCRRIGSVRVKSPVRKPTGKPIYATQGKSVAWNDNDVRDTTVRTHADADGMENVDSWECREGCPVKAMDAQSGIRPAGKWCRHRDTSHPFGNAKGVEYDNWKDSDEPPGGAARFFKQVEGT